ncbi:lipopolysaccharide biosynthesis protein [Photorhabdus laumondii]|uniref:lipopolysaccharide biosynthesis protein n=1 Tax=Photorhabdus laumondii TaxID=2218628 RepID=UPI003315F157
MTRTHNSLRNIKYALIFFILNFTVNYFSRAVFIEHLGLDVLGINQTMVNLVGFLSLTELGIAVAIASSLYAPLKNGNTAQITDIVSIQGWMYKNVAIIVLLLSVIISLFFPFWFSDVRFPKWYIYATFYVLLSGVLAEYFFSYKKILFTANQKDYQAQKIIQLGRVLKVTFQILCLLYFEHGYVYWLIIEIINVIMTNTILYLKVKSEYHNIASSIKRGAKVRRNYPDIVKKTKQLFFHKISGFILIQATPLVVLAYTSLEMMGIYSNYVFVMTAISAMMYMFNNAALASIGNLIEEKNHKKIMSFYWQYHVFIYFISAIICYSFYNYINEFIVIWVGKEYQIHGTPIILMTFYIALMITRIQDVFLSAKGLFSDIWAPITEGIINLSLSIILGYYFGLSGVLIGICVSLFIIVFIWKSYFLFTSGFGENYVIFIIKSTKLISIAIISAFITNTLLKSLTITFEETIFNFLYQISISLFIYSNLLFILLYVFHNSFRMLVARFKVFKRI